MVDESSFASPFYYIRHLPGGVAIIIRLSLEVSSFLVHWPDGCWILLAQGTLDLELISFKCSAPSPSYSV